MDHLSHRIKIILKKIAGLAFKPFLSVDLRQLFSKKKKYFWGSHYINQSLETDVVDDNDDVGDFGKSDSPFVLY